MRCYKKCNCRRSKPCCDLKDVEGCWDNCRCMDEILDTREAIEEIDKVVNDALGRVIRNETVVKDNLQNASRLVLNLAEKEDDDVHRLTDKINANDAAIRAELQQEVNRATTKENEETNRATAKENEIVNDLNSYKTSNNNALSAEVQRATNAEQNLNTIKANAANVYTKQEIDTKFTNLINGAPAALDTLGEIAAKLADNDDVASAIINTISQETTNRQNADITINNSISSLTARISTLESKVAALEALWTDNGSSLVAKSGRSVTGAGFYDSTIN